MKTSAKKTPAPHPKPKAPPAAKHPPAPARKPAHGSGATSGKASGTQSANRPAAKPVAAQPVATKPASRPAKAAVRPAALQKPSAAQKSGPATAVSHEPAAPKAAPAHAASKPAPAAAKPARAAVRPLTLAASAVAAHPQPAAPKPAAPAASAENDKSKGGSKKPKPPAKTMRVPAPMTDYLIKRDLPDVRRVASAALLADTGRGIAPPAPHGKSKEPERTGEPPVDASLIASSLASDVHPKIEDNYDYSVLQDLASSPWCPSPTRMISTGCGGGEPAVFFAKRGFNVVGIDSDRTAVGLARERAWLAGVEIDFMVGEQFETPNLLPAESFGLAIDRGAFYRLTDDRDRQRYLANIRRLLFQGGICYLSAGFFPLPEGVEKPKSSKKASPKILLVREGGMIVNEVRQAGFEVVHRVLRPTADSGEFGELFLYLKK